MDYILKKTTELLEVEKNQISNLFTKVFEKTKTIEEFDNQFLSTCLGYSLHCFFKENEEIVGIQTFIPYKYNYLGKEIIIGLLVDVMVLKEYRSLKNFVMMTLKLHEAAKDNNVSLLYAYPNKNSYPIFTKMLEYKDIGCLDYYILPINIGTIKPTLKAFNFVSRTISSILCLPIFSSFSNNSKNDYNIQKIDDEQFRLHRYTDKHKIVKQDNYEFIYKIEVFKDVNLKDLEGIKIAYIVDVKPLTKRNLEKATTYLLKQYKSNIDSITYIGNLPFQPLNLIKVPVKLQPRSINFIYKTIDENLIDDDIASILSSWQSNLSDFDAI